MPEWLEKEMEECLPTFYSDPMDPMGRFDIGVERGFQKCYELMFEHYDKKLKDMALDNIDVNKELIDLKHIYEETKKANKWLSQDYMKLKKRMKLKPIETAPEGMNILIRHEYSGDGDLMWSEGYRKEEFFITEYGHMISGATHWTELPDCEGL